MPRPAPSRPAKRTGRDADKTRTLKLNGSAWQKLRASVLAGEPLCRHCAARGLVVPATDVDHMNGADDNRLESLQPLCHECHSRKTAAEHGKRATYGCDASGTPADPSHYWNQAVVRDPGASPAPAFKKSPATDRPRPSCSPCVRPKSKDSL
ncbi:HNH endonuclease signature motif containing protein [Acidovorax carolinensis]|uniref:HNH endonuclease signature motif containing protein n=1 Tax=Acidovorax carolinensis TaxID=553814 RepID=UPI0012FF788B|nr:HNH endonuclease signature motif containing protein [Acidovorax carolinensis]